MDTQRKFKLEKGNCKRSGIVKDVKVILSPEAEEVYNYLVSEAEHSKIEKRILNSFDKKK